MGNYGRQAHILAMMIPNILEINFIPNILGMCMGLEWPIAIFPIHSE
jgi:hypothetical protein